MGQNRLEPVWTEATDMEISALFVSDPPEQQVLPPKLTQFKQVGINKKNQTILLDISENVNITFTCRQMKYLSADDWLCKLTYIVQRVTAQLNKP